MFSVLVIEDHKQVAQVVESLLLRIRLNATVVHSLKDAVDLLVSSSFDLIVSDYSLIQADDVAHEQFQMLSVEYPLIYTSGMFFEIDIQLSDSRAIYYLPKPFSGKEISEAIQICLSSTPSQTVED